MLVRRRHQLDVIMRLGQHYLVRVSVVGLSILRWPIAVIILAAGSSHSCSVRRQLLLRVEDEVLAEGQRLGRRERIHDLVLRELIEAIGSARRFAT